MNGNLNLDSNVSCYSKGMAGYDIVTLVLLAKAQHIYPPRVDQPEGHRELITACYTRWQANPHFTIYLSKCDLWSQSSNLFLSYRVANHPLKNGIVPY